MTVTTGGNPHRGELGFEIGDQRWTFAFGTNALCVIEETFDLDNITELGTILGGTPSMRKIRTLFRIGLTDCHPEMTDFEAGQIMEAVGGLEPSLELVMRAIETAFPEAAKDGAKGPRMPAPKASSGRGTGRSSTSRGAKRN